MNIIHIISVSMNTAKTVALLLNKSHLYTHYFTDITYAAHVVFSKTKTSLENTLTIYTILIFK